MSKTQDIPIFPHSPPPVIAGLTRNLPIRIFRLAALPHFLIRLAAEGSLA